MIFKQLFKKQTKMKRRQPQILLMTLKLLKKRRRGKRRRSRRQMRTRGVRNLRKRTKVPLKTQKPSIQVSFNLSSRLQIFQRTRIKHFIKLFNW